MDCATIRITNSANKTSESPFWWNNRRIYIAPLVISYVEVLAKIDPAAQRTAEIEITFVLLT